MLNHRGWILLSALTVIALSGCQLGTPEGKQADRLVLEGKHEAAEELYRMQLTRLESELLDAPNPQLQNEHRELLEKLAKLNQHRLRRYEAAVNDWKRLIETHPNSELATEAGLAIAELYRYRLERPKDAIEAYEALRETLRDPASRARVGLELVDLLFDLKRFERVEVLSAEIEESNEDPKLDYRAAFLRARALTILERHSEAVEVWSSLEIMEDPVVHAQILFEKSFALEASGQRVDAIECLHQALEHHPNPSLVQGMLNDLKTRTEMSEGGRAVHGSRAPARRQQARSQARQPPLTSSKKTVKAPKQVQRSTPKPRGKTAATSNKKAAAPQKAAPPQEPTKAATKEDTKVTPTKAATTPTPAPKASPAKPSPTPDPKASDTP